MAWMNRGYNLREKQENKTSGKVIFLVNFSLCHVCLSSKRILAYFLLELTEKKTLKGIEKSNTSAITSAYLVLW